jgi:hypothetical protein
MSPSLSSYSPSDENGELEDIPLVWGVTVRCYLKNNWTTRFAYEFVK